MTRLDPRSRALLAGLVVLALLVVGAAWWQAGARERATESVRLTLLQGCLERVTHGQGTSRVCLDTYAAARP